MSVQFSSVSEPQHASPPCPSPTPGVYPNSCPLSWWCHPTISSSVVPFSSCLQSFPASGSFQMSQLFVSGGHRIGVSVWTTKNLVSLCHHRVDPLIPFCIPKPSPLVIAALFSVSSCLILFGLFSYSLFSLFFIFHINEIIWYLSFSIWLISLSTMPSKSIHVVINDKSSCFLAD